MKSLVATMLLLLLMIVAGGAIPAAAQSSTRDECPDIIPAEMPMASEDADWADTLDNAHALATGTGVTVAVIDTGVFPHPQLRSVAAGGDLVGSSPGAEAGGLEDCDGHGTIIAGVIAAEGNAYVPRGVAPGATILSIRQTSAVAQVVPNNPGEEGGDATGTLGTLAAAIHAALDQGAGVINISVVSCLPGGQLTGPSSLDQALTRAEAEQAVIVAAGGNVGPDCPSDARVIPAHSETVLSVAALADNHTFTDYSVQNTGPQLSAPGHVPRGISPRGDGIALGMRTQVGEVSFEGTSFAAPVVSGTAALLRERFPESSASEIRERIMNSVDPQRGAINPYRALTYVPSDTQPLHVTTISAPTPPDTRARDRGIQVFVALAAAALIVGTAVGLLRRT